MKLYWRTVNPSKVWLLLISDRLSKIPIPSSLSMHSSWTSCWGPPSLNHLGPGASYYIYKPSCHLCLLSRGLQHCFTSGVILCKIGCPQHLWLPLLWFATCCSLMLSPLIQVGGDYSKLNPLREDQKKYTTDFLFYTCSPYLSIILYHLVKCQYN